jgi:hypothetical protein
MGMSRASVNHLLLKLMTAGVVKRVGYGEYALKAKL